ncbi:MAG TPA: cupin domain-containing protein [Geminicoccaceae bacterium]|nr:cupin domain-containing protein [Geminicoccaceae bacterium]
MQPSVCSRSARTLLVALGLALAGSGALAQSSSEQALPQGFQTTPVLKSGTTAGGARISYPQSGTPEIVSVTGVLEPGGRTARHQHPVPVYVYVLEGTLKVQADDHEPREYRAGEAFLEDVDHWHQAFNEGDTPTKILVVFVGEEGKPTTIAAQ